MIDDELGGVAQISQKLDVDARCGGFEAAGPQKIFGIASIHR